MKKFVMKKGYEARVLTLTRPSGITWFLVRVGEYPDKAAANQAKASFIQKSGFDALVRPAGRF
ncbi:MAG: SPOR domain-containing protein, partial [Desulfobacterales bacterium]|nr:SPOR domain-containing protein [Desulfobacterales bacterium]